VLLGACGGDPKPGEVKDEAMLAGLQGGDLPGSADDYYRDMDRGWGEAEVAAALAPLGLSPEQAWESYNRGRNNWAVWTGGNDRFWDFMANNTFGALDFLKTLSSHPDIRYCGDSYYGWRAYDDDECVGTDRKWYEASRDNRWKYFGLVNEPCFEKATGPDPERYGLWLDKRIVSDDCPPDPFEDETRYPGVRFGERGKNVPAGSYYGSASGIFGLRLFPNPLFDKKAEEAWGDGSRFYDDRDFYESSSLVRPYRVGMTCGFCHVGPSPINPPDDPENPRLANLTSNPGAQYFWIDRIFFWNAKGRHNNFVYQLFHTSLPGSLDTSLVSSDNINNPRTMNAVYSIGARLSMAALHPEYLAAGSLDNKQFNDYQRTSALSEYFRAPDEVRTTHVLKDGSDSVGLLGALNRVYLNIGLFSEEWLLHFRPLIGGKITPIPIAAAEENSTYWNANLDQTPDLALFFAASAQPDRLKDAPGGPELLARYQADAVAEGGFESVDAMTTRGKLAFAENCGRCHSGKQPENLCALGHQCETGQILVNSGAYFDWLREEVLEDDYLEGNFLSSEVRIPVTELGTNACSPLATNGLEGDIWDNFTSQTYKELPAVGKVTVEHPLSGEPSEYEMPGGGRGYTRPASLISLWSTAPFLLNNSVGHFNWDPSVEGRLQSFDDSIQKMLWPERRLRDDQYVDYLRTYGSDLEGYEGLSNVPGYIQRTTSTSYLRIPKGYLPDALSALGGIEIGPIPAGTPVNLLANVSVLSEDRSLGARKDQAKKLIRLLKKVVRDLKDLPDDATPQQQRDTFRDLVDPLLEVSKCKDFVVNKGHYFGSNLSDADKVALIEFLRTF